MLNQKSSIFDMSKNIILCLSLLMLVGGIDNSLAAKKSKIVHTTKFTVNYTGIRIGRLTFTIEIDGDDYLLKANGKTDGVARLFSKGKGSFESAGHFKGDKVISSAHKVQVTEKGKTARLKMSFDEGNLKKMSASPKKKRRKGKGYIPILKKHLQSIIDPASSIVVPTQENASGGRDVCGRTLNVYDGETRFDIVLSYVATRPISAKGYKGLAYVCNFRYVPIAGHKKGHKSVEIMRKNKNMEIWLAPITGTSIFTPIKIDVNSPIGRFVAYPKRFSALVSQ